MNDHKTPLGGFEQRLLTELRAEIETAPALASRASRSHKRRFAITGALAAGAAAAIAGPLLLTGSHAPSAAAYTVTKTADGDISVVVNQAKDADGLEKAFADKGVRARVFFLPYGKKCAEQFVADGPGLPSIEDDRPAVGEEGPVTFTFDPDELGNGILVYSVSLDKDSSPDDKYLRAWATRLFTSAPDSNQNCTLVDAPPQ